MDSCVLTRSEMGFCVSGILKEIIEIIFVNYTTKEKNKIVCMSHERTRIWEGGGHRTNGC